MVKRVKGEGSWSYPKDGGVRLKVMYDGKAKYFYGQSEDVCLEKKRNFEALRKKGIDSEDSVTVEKYVTNWMKTVKAKKLKKRSYDRLESSVMIWVIPCLGDYKFNKLDSMTIQIDLIDRMQEAGRSLSSIKKAKDALNGAYTYALRTRAVDYNPVDAVELPSPDNFEVKEIEYFNKDERKRFIDTATSYCLTGRQRYTIGWFMVLMLQTGLRIGEALAIRHCDINLDKRIIYIDSTIVSIKNRNAKEGDLKWLLIDQPLPKGNRSRYVHLNDMAIRAIWELNQIFSYEPQGYLIHNDDGQFYTFGQVDATFKKILNRAELKKCGVHSLRHSTAVALLEAKIPIETISDILGHSDISITYRVYAKVIEELKAEAMNIINNVI